MKMRQTKISVLCSSRKITAVQSCSCSYVLIHVSRLLLVPAASLASAYQVPVEPDHRVAGLHRQPSPPDVQNFSFAQELPPTWALLTQV